MNHTLRPAAVALMLLLPAWGNAQNDKQDDFRKSFAEFRREIQEEYNNFLGEINKEYVDFLKEAWKDMPGHKPLPEPTPIKEDPVVPIVAPEPAPRPQPLPDGNRIPVKVQPTPKPEPAPAPPAPIREVPQPVVRYVKVHYFGIEASLRCDASQLPRLGGVSEQEVSRLWQTLCDGRTNNLLSDCLRTRTDHDLCDWAYVQLLREVAAACYPAASLVNERTAMHMFLLAQSGFRVRMGRTDGRLYTLLATDSRLFKYSYWTIDNREYYLIDNEASVNRLYISSATLPGEQAARMVNAQHNLFGSHTGTRRTLQSKRYPEVQATIETNQNLIDFFNRYPRSYAAVDYKTVWRYYALTPLSEPVRRSLYPALQKAIDGKGTLEKVEVLLNFVQTAFVYGYDDSIWGGDRPFFAEETLHYPYSDCEDRAILFSRLVRDLVQLDVALIYHPGHLYAAVRFPSSVSVGGDYIVVDGARYTIADPTYIGARVGMTMPKMDNSKATAILVR